jgi:hypothetical protein
MHLHGALLPSALEHDRIADADVFDLCRVDGWRLAGAMVGKPEGLEPSSLG